MTRGTRVFLLIAGLFVGVLVVYYGFYTDTLNPDEVATATDDDDAAADAAERGSAPTPDPNANANEAVASPPPARAPQRRETTPRREPVTTSGESTLPVNVPERRLRDPLTESPTTPRPTTTGRTPANDPPRRDEGTTPGGPAEHPGTRTPPAPTGGRAEAPRSNQPANNGGATTPPANDSNVSSNKPAAIHTPPASRERRYVIRKDDSLYRIAERELGDPQQWRRILAANPGLKADALPIGDSIVIPARETARSATAPKPTTGPVMHVVRSGENLSSIAGRYYGDESKWRTIYDANKRVIGGDPDALDEGMKLVIPAR